MKIEIEIPDNCDLVKDGNTYIVKEKKQVPPRSWEEFCSKHPLGEKDFYIDCTSDIQPCSNGRSVRDPLLDRNVCTSKEEAEVFLALMQLRQLRKAWVGDWKSSSRELHAIITFYKTDEIRVAYGAWEFNYVLSFPNQKMAEDFLSCFRDLCETAKPLL